VSRANWEPKNWVAVKEVPADVFRGPDLRTKNCELSFWRIDLNAPEGWKDVVLALAAGYEQPDVVDLAWVRRGSLTRAGIEVVDSEGTTLVDDLKDQHVNVVRLDTDRVATVASHLGASLRGDSWRRVSPNEVLEILAAAVRAKRLNVKRLKEKCRVEVEKLL
jgi:hypothetical protein